MFDSSAVIRSALPAFFAVVLVALFIPLEAFAQTRASSATSQGSFDQLIIFGQSVDKRSFETRFQIASTSNFRTSDELDLVATNTMRPGVPPTASPMDALLRFGIARHYTFKGSMLRIDELNSSHYYLINCKTHSEISVDSDSHTIIKSPIPDAIAKWSAGEVFSIARAVGPPGVGVHNPDTVINGNALGSQGYQFSIVSWAGDPPPGTDVFLYRYDLPIPKFSCQAADALPLMLLTGVLGPLSTALLYQEQFRARGLRVSLDLGKSPDNNFSLLRFKLRSLAVVAGSVERGNFSSEVSADAFTIPAGYPVNRPPRGSNALLYLSP